MTFGLTITIDRTGVERIQGAGQCVALTWLDPALGDVPPVLWLAIEAAQTITVSWSSGVGVYLTTAPLTPGSLLVANAWSGAHPGWRYTFRRGCFDAGADTGTAYTVINQTPDRDGGFYSFGLTLDATVNGEARRTPINALTLLYGQDLSFGLPAALLISLDYAHPDGTVRRSIPSTALLLTLDPQQTSAEVAFDDATNTFLMTSAAKA